MTRECLKSLLDRLGIQTYWVRNNLSELSMLWLRMTPFLRSRNRVLKEIRLTDGPKLIFGCGDIRREGWWGIDAVRTQSVDLMLDLRRPLPFESDSIDLCYSEHFLEHLNQAECERHLAEVLRILKPGGRYRIVVPHFRRFAENYVSGNREFFERAFPWEERPIRAVFAIANFEGAHRNLFDVAELVLLGEQAGFAGVEESEVNISSVPALNIDIADPQRVAESLYVEMIKAAD
jgi:predicted SAM-dependent methyltransferase